MRGIPKRQSFGYMMIGVLLALAVQLVGGAIQSGPNQAIAAPSIAFAAHDRAAAPLRAHVLQPLAPVPGTQGIKIFQFGLVPSGLAKLFPKAQGVVTINGGNAAISLYDTITVDVA